MTDAIESWPGRPYPLGASYDGAGTNFSLFSEVAEHVELSQILAAESSTLPWASAWLARILAAIAAIAALAAPPAPEQRPVRIARILAGQRARRRHAIPDSASSTTRLARNAVISAWSYGGATSTTSIPATGSSIAIRRTASSSCRPVSPPGSGVPVPGAMPGSTTSTSTDRKTASQSSSRDGERLGQAFVQAPRHDLGHLVAAHLLVGHPVQRLRLRPVAAQPDLQEPVAAHRAGLDQPAHRRAVPVQRAELGVAGVGVRVEVDQRHPAPAHVPGHAGRVGERDRVVAAEDHRDRAARQPPSARPLRSLRSESSVSPDGISMSPASAIRSSASGSTPSARCGREPSCGR